MHAAELFLALAVQETLRWFTSLQSHVTSCEKSVGNRHFIRRCNVKVYNKLLPSPWATTRVVVLYVLRREQETMLVCNMCFVENVAAVVNLVRLSWNVIGLLVRRG